jgi:hypothetical protein
MRQVVLGCSIQGDIPAPPFVGDQLAPVVAAPQDIL